MYKSVAVSLIPVLLFSVAPSAGQAKNIFAGFSLAPTFTPPPGCLPNDSTYGVLSRCERTIEPGHRFFVYVDTAWGAGTTKQIFVDDHVQDIKSFWKNDYAGTMTSFSSQISTVVPSGDLPDGGTECREYSISVVDDPSGDPPTQTHWLMSGLTCAWYIENPNSNVANINLFWLEIHEGYDPKKSQKPTDSFDSTVRDVFRSVRLIRPTSP